MRCASHGKTNCQNSTCRDRERRGGEGGSLRATAYDPLTDPLSPLHQAVYGGVSYGSGSASSSSSCDSSSSSASYDSGPSSCGE